MSTPGASQDAEGQVGAPIGFRVSGSYLQRFDLVTSYTTNKAHSNRKIQVEAPNVTKVE